MRSPFKQLLKILLRLLREGLGRLIILISNLTLPKQIERSSDAKAALKDETSGLFLYEFYACPFCIKTRRAIHRLNIDVSTRDIRKHQAYYQELEAQGSTQVPCLKIEQDNAVKWLYESSDIINYLNSRFDNT
jgi:glutaredoxin